jgi:DNA-binding response OmpR family regulator
VRKVLIATDADELFDEVDAALAGPDTTVVRVNEGAEVQAAVIAGDPDLVFLDLQIGNMGGMATCMNLRLEEGAGRLDTQRIVMLLDRTADVFLAKRSGADGWLVKPIDALRLRRAATAVLDGDGFAEGLAG